MSGLSSGSADDGGKFNGKLLVALAQAKNSETIGRVVDDSLKRAAELRKLREEADAKQREQDRIDERAIENERLEKKSAGQISQRQSEQGAQIAERDAERRAAENARVIAAAQNRPAENGWTGEFARNLTPIQLSA